MDKLDDKNAILFAGAVLSDLGIDTEGHDLAAIGWWFERLYKKAYNEAVRDARELANKQQVHDE